MKNISKKIIALMLQLNYCHLPTSWLTEKTFCTLYFVTCGDRERARLGKLTIPNRLFGSCCFYLFIYFFFLFIYSFFIVFFLKKKKKQKWKKKPRWF
jgi:hypothetical protein